MSTDPASEPRAIVESFLQTVVILDDIVVMSQQGVEQQDEVQGTAIVTPDYPESAAPDENGLNTDRSDVPLNADTVINAFADLGVVCAVLNAPDNAFPARIAKAAHRADIVVLDWKIGDSDGDITLEVMKKILQEDQNNPRLRLIAIYTGEPDLASVSDRVRAALQEFYVSSRASTIDSIRISKGPAHVVVLAKSGAINEHSTSLGYEQVSEGDLADRLVDEFVSMTSGLLRNVALAGIATIRENSHRVLAKFDETLDAAYLGHRILLPHPPDAEDHLVAALGSELISVLEEDRPGTHADIEAIERWLSRDGVPDTSVPFQFSGTASAVDRWLPLLRSGIESSKVQLPEGGKPGLVRDGTAAFTDDPADAMLSNHRFASLLKLKTRYPQQRRTLTLGTIVRISKDDRFQYLLCLQPKCDSVRLESASGFPFIPLEPVRGGSSKTPVAMVVEVQTGDWKHLGATPKPSELIVRSFEPGSNPPGDVLATKETSGAFYFEDVNGTKYQWIAEMKDEHAFGIAGAVAAALARPGPNDAEWLRRRSG